MVVQYSTVHCYWLNEIITDYRGINSLILKWSFGLPGVVGHPGGLGWGGVDHTGEVGVPSISQP